MFAYILYTSLAGLYLDAFLDIQDDWEDIEICQRYERRYAKCLCYGRYWRCSL